jgi:two-component system, LytTR family, response regulator LytT
MALPNPPSPAYYDRRELDRGVMSDLRILQSVYWIVVYLFLSLLFGLRGEYALQSLIFAALLMPVAIGATHVVSRRLIPDFLGRDNLQFAFWLAFVLVASVYLILMVITGLFIVIAEYDIRALNPAIRDFFYAMGGAFLVIAPAVAAHAVRQSQRYRAELEALGVDRVDHADTADQAWLPIRVDGRTERVRTNEITYLETFGDHVHIHMESGMRVTREPLYSILERLPDSFSRIHRSYAVNLDRCDSYTREEISLGDLTLPISRSYRAATLSRLGDELR